CINMHGHAARPSAPALHYSAPESERRRGGTRVEHSQPCSDSGLSPERPFLFPLGAPMTLRLYDTTLRDGTQREGLSLSVEDKVKIATALDWLGVSYIEGGWPGSNPKDAEFFSRIARVPLVHAKVAAFGSTRRAHVRCGEDPSLRALVDAETPVVTLVGKSSTLHVERILETTRLENLRMIG